MGANTLMPIALIFYDNHLINISRNKLEDLLLLSLKRGLKAQNEICFFSCISIYNRKIARIDSVV